MMEAPPKQLPMHFPGFIIPSADWVSSKKRALFQFLLAHHPSISEYNDLQATTAKNAEVLAHICNEIFHEAKWDLTRQHLFNAVSCKLSTVYTYWTHKPVHVSDLQHFILNLCASRGCFLRMVEVGLVEPYANALTNDIDAIITRLYRNQSTTQDVGPAERKRHLDAEAPASKRRRVAIDRQIPSVYQDEKFPENIFSAEYPQIAELRKQLETQKDDIATYQGRIKVYENRVDILERALNDYEQLVTSLSAVNGAARENIGTLRKRLWTKIPEPVNDKPGRATTAKLGDSTDYII